MDINGLNNNPNNTSKAKSGGSVVTPDENQPKQSNESSNTNAKDTVRISPESQNLSRLSKQLGSNASVNREKVEALKAAIADGSYDVNPQEIAKKLLKEDSLF